MKGQKILAALAAACALGACATTSKDQAKSETTGQYIDDATLTARVKTAIASGVGIAAASNVNVETTHGVVQLSGYADSADQANRAAKTASNVSGVRSVQNDIRVKSGS